MTPRGPSPGRGEPHCDSQQCAKAHRPFSTAPQASEKHRIRAGPEVFSLNVTSRFEGDIRHDLAQDNSPCSSDGATGLTYFMHHLPIALAMLIDRREHGAAHGRMRRKAIGLRRNCGAGPRADSRLRQPASPQASGYQQGRRARAAIHAKSAGGSTALPTASNRPEGDRQIKAKHRRDQAQAIVVLSRTAKTRRAGAFEEVLEIAKRSEPAIYTRPSSGETSR